MEPIDKLRELISPDLLGVTWVPHVTRQHGGLSGPYVLHFPEGRQVVVSDPTSARCVIKACARKGIVTHVNTRQWNREAAWNLMILVSDPNAVRLAIQKTTRAANG